MLERTSRLQADTDYLIGPKIVIDENGLDIAKLGLEFRVGNKHFRQGDMKLKCLATIATVYKQSNEESVVGDESILKTSIMESRETRAQSHTREDLTNGKTYPRINPLPSPPVPQLRNVFPELSINSLTLTFISSKLDEM